MNMARVCRFCLVIYRLHEFNIIENQNRLEVKDGFMISRRNKYIPPTIAIIHSNQIRTTYFKELKTHFPNQIKMYSLKDNSLFYFALYLFDIIQESRQNMSYEILDIYVSYV
jgi:hypothetical protein